MPLTLKINIKELVSLRIKETAINQKRHDFVVKIIRYGENCMRNAV